VSAKFRLSDADLARSIKGLGPLLPEFLDSSGRTIDGHRRRAICDRHGLELDRVVVSPARVKPLLFLLHPERLSPDQYSGEHRQRALLQAASDCWVSPATIAELWLAGDPRQQEGTRWQRMAQSFRVALQRQAMGSLELTASELVSIVRRTL
jgi:hypothetical protein